MILFLKILGLVIAAFFAAIIIYFLFVFVCGLFVDPKKEYEEPSRFYRALMNSVTAFILKAARVRIHTSGAEKVPKDTKKLLFVSNHRSNFDPLITWHFFKEWQMVYVSKDANFRLPIAGRIIRRCCFMSIDRENPKNAMKTIQKAAGVLKKGEMSVGVYPEGTRSKDCTLLPFHNGIFKIAQKADADIVVFSISGTENIHKNFPFHHTDIYLDVLDIIPSDEIKGIKTDVIGDRVREMLEQKLK